MDQSAYLRMLSDAVSNRECQLKREAYQSSFASLKSLKQLPEESETTVTLNLETIILIESKLQHIAKNIAAVHQPRQNSSLESFETYDKYFSELVELCEDYWYILRIETTLFGKLP
jgi:uncharacterized protein YllA (UPF0747 family)